MADVDFDIEELDLDSIDIVEEFYNPFHDPKTGRFTFKKGGKKGKIHVPMSDAARRSNAVMRSLAAARRSKEYKTARQRIAGSWADREKGQGGLRGVKGANSKKADAARAANAKKGAQTKRVNTALKNQTNKIVHKNTKAGPEDDAIALTKRFGSRRG